MASGRFGITQERAIYGGVVTALLSVVGILYGQTATNVSADVSKALECCNKCTQDLADHTLLITGDIGDIKADIKVIKAHMEYLGDEGKRNENLSGAIARSLASYIHRPGELVAGGTP